MVVVVAMAVLSSVVGGGGRSRWCRLSQVEVVTGSREALVLDGFVCMS